MTEDAIAFGGIDRKDGIHARHHFMFVHGDVIRWRIHKVHGVMCTRRGVRANMGRDDNVTGQYIALALHLCQLQRAANGGNGAIGIRNQPNTRRTCAYPPSRPIIPSVGALPPDFARGCRAI